MTAPAGTKINGGTFTVPPALGNRLFHPFSDFLIHDVNTGDGIEIAVVEHFGKRFAPMLEVRLTSEGVKYRTLNLDTITSVVENGQIIRKRAKGTILAELKKEGPCLSAEAKPAKAPSK